MRIKRSESRQSRRIAALPGLAVVAAASVMSLGIALAHAQTKDGDQPQKVFATPDAAVDALLAAFKKGEQAPLLEIFGHEHEELIAVSDKVAQAETFKRLVQAIGERKKLDKQEDGSLQLIVGEKEWPFPIPLVKEKAGWRFDTAAGFEEILNRRIGKHELEAIETCRAYVEAQIAYVEQDRDGDEVLEYAQRVGSSKGKKDGLYWPADPDKGEEESPFGPLVAESGAYLKAAKESDKKLPFHGYYFKILTKQGKNPPGGKYDYVINGNMIAGFALLAAPADYHASGIMSFVVSHQGKIYEKDLGEKTHEIAKAMTEYNPDVIWQLVGTVE